jgi:hypothetical protein
MEKPIIQPFVQLGTALEAISIHSAWPGFECGITSTEFDHAHSLIQTLHHHNGWFTAESCNQALAEWATLLTAESLTKWLEPYPASIQQRRVGIICAGNIPAVGFHDVVSVLLSGHHALIKLSKDDQLLIPLFLDLLCTFDAASKNRFTLVERLTEFDAVIATGSNNSARYFESYFGHVPHIIRKSRTSVAVLHGQETDEELAGLAQDIFTYFGLGCRNVSKVYLPRTMDLDRVFNALYPYQWLANHAKYANNYDYNKAVWLLNREELLENGFILLKEDERLACPTASLFYERYDNLSDIETQLEALAEHIQCRLGVNGIPLGSAQKPQLNDYADGVDTMAFLSRL